VGPRDGLPGLANLLSAHLAIAALALLPLLWLTRSRALAIAFGVLLIGGALRFGDEWISTPAPTALGTDLRVATWNLEFGAIGIAAGLDGLRSLEDVDIVALQELTPEQARAIELDPLLSTTYPHRAMAPAPGTGGIGLLGTRPFSDVQSFSDPVSVRATVELDGDTVVVHNAHPLPASIGTVTAMRLPVAYDSAARDEALARIRERMAMDMIDGEAVLLIGDFNVAPTEPGYEPLAAGLVDAHREIGSGPGWTWRPSRFEFLGVGLLRIDYVFMRGLEPLAITTDCTRPGDHCLVVVDLARR